MTPEEIERLRKLKAEKEAQKTSSSQAPKNTAQKATQKPFPSPISPELFSPMPLATQDATAPENVDIKDGSVETNPFLTAASFVAPLAVDEIETHGLSRPGVLAAKAGGDAGMMLIPVTKVAGAGLKVASAGMKAGNRISRAGNFMTNPWTSMNTGTRMGGQAVANSIDNAIYSGIQMGLDNRERDFSEALAEMAVGTGLGGITGGIGGLSSKNSAINYETHLHKKTKAKQGSVKDKEFEMLDRFNDENLTKSEQTANLIADHPLNENFPYLPPTWSQLDQNYKNAIENKLKETNALSKSVEGQSTTIKKPVEVQADNGKLYPVGVETKNGIKIQEPIFNKPNERKAFANNVNDFLTTNNLGTYDFENGLIVLSEGVLPSDAEIILKKSRQGNFTTKGQKDWKEELRIALREARGGDVNPKGERVKFTEITTPASSYGEAMNDLEKLRRQRQVLNYASGGEGFNPSPKKIGFTSTLNRETRPAIGLWDFDTEFMPRNIAASGANAYDRREELFDYAEKLVELGKMTYEEAMKFIEQNSGFSPMPLTMEKQ